MPKGKRTTKDMTKGEEVISLIFGLGKPTEKVKTKRGERRRDPNPGKRDVQDAIYTVIGAPSLTRDEDERKKGK